MDAISYLVLWSELRKVHVNDSLFLKSQFSKYFVWIPLALKVSRRHLQTRLTFHSLYIAVNLPTDNLTGGAHAIVYKPTGRFSAPMKFTFESMKISP